MRQAALGILLWIPLWLYAAGDLSDMNIEQLMDLEVTTVSKKTQKLSETSAAIYVISSEDIQHSGASSLAEVMRMAPGVNVARINQSQWAVSARGFNHLYSNKLLVLIDGRSVYSSFFSGVHWDIQDMNLNDIDRIEIIRGPGATLWGANAVNGVINIITKSSTQTQGSNVSLKSGTNQPYQV